MRSVVLERSRAATADMGRTRRAVVEGLSFPPVVGSGSADDFVSRLGASPSASNFLIATSRMGLATSSPGSVQPPPAPSLDFVRVVVDGTRGNVDASVCEVVFSIRSEELNLVKGFRLMRAAGKPNQEMSVPSVSTLTGLSSGEGFRKNTDAIANNVRSVRQSGAGNALTTIIADDPHDNRRSVIGPSEAVRLPPPPVNTNRTGSPAGLVSIKGADRSVLEDQAFYINSRATTVSTPPDLGPRSIGPRLLGDGVSRGGFVSTVQDNSGEFREVANVTTDRLTMSEEGDFRVVSIDDPTVIWGGTYSYFVVAFDDGMRESVRSRIVTVSVTSLTPPRTPEVSFSLVSGVPQFSIHCPGDFPDHIEVYRRGPSRLGREVVVIGSTGSIVSTTIGAVLTNGFMRMDDVGLLFGNASFSDVDVIPGKDFDYRFYSVDGFGSKSQTPFECRVSIPDDDAAIPLARPFLTVEQDSDARSVRIITGCDDPRTIGVTLSRRTVSDHETDWHPPNQPERCWMTVVRPISRPSVSYPHLVTPDAWVGDFSVDSSEVVEFFDTTVAYDRVYQYAAQAIDVHGNRTDYAISQKIRVSLQVGIDPPLNLSARVLEADDHVSGVALSWLPGTSDISPEDLMGNQTELADTIVRSVFQVERREAGGQWIPMEPVSSSHFVDPVSSEQAPSFRAPYAIAGETYEYRVIAMQVDGNVSPYTEPVQISLVPTLVPSPVLSVRATPLSIRPFQVVVSWDYTGEFIDRWEVERAVTNKVYGSRVTDVETDIVGKVPFSRVASVPREASRSSSANIDGVKRFVPGVVMGNRFFVDSEVEMDQSYFYRVRAVDISGKMSGWSYRGIQLADGPHDSKLSSVLSNEEKSIASRDPSPIRVKRGT